MSDVPPPAMPGSGDGPSAAPVPPRADLDALAPPPAPQAPAETPRRRGLLMGIVAAVVAVAAVGAFAVLRSAGGIFPERIGDYERMHDAQARSFEDSLKGFKMGDMTIQGALYGESRSMTPALVVEVMAGDSSLVSVTPVEDFMRGAAGGFEGSGAGTIDVDAGTSDTRDGVEYLCAPVQVSAGSRFGSDSTACAWKGPDDIGLVFVTGSTDLHTGFDRAELVFGAVHA